MHTVAASCIMRAYLSSKYNWSSCIYIRVQSYIKEELRQTKCGGVQVCLYCNTKIPKQPVKCMQLID